MNKISHKELEQDLAISFETKTPAFIQGAIGIGKSDTIRKVSKDYAKRHNLVYKEWSRLNNDARNQIANGKIEDISTRFILFDIRSASLDPSDIKGLPNLQGSYINWLPDIIFKVASRPDFHGVLFFDEINQAVPTVQSALYQVVLDNCAGTVRLSDNCIRIAAGNRSKDKSNVNKMSLALQARFTNTELACPSAKEWVDNYAIPNKIHRNIQSYLLYQPDHISVDINEIKDQLNFANPRNWTRLSKQLHQLDSMNKDKSNDYYSRVERLAEWNIGGEPAIKFSAYVRLQNVIDHHKVMEEPGLIRSLPIDQKWFVMDMIVSEYAKHGKKVIEEVCGIMTHVDGDLAMNFYKNCTQENKLFPSQLSQARAGRTWATEIVKILASEVSCQ